MEHTVLRLITTEDGSHTLYREDLKESYHSLHGAKGESVHVFIEQGMRFMVDVGMSALNVFEVGLGTGLNALLSARFSNDHQVRVTYHTIEPVPVPPAIYNQLNYGADEDERRLLHRIHECPWGEEVEIADGFFLFKHETTLEKFPASEYATSFNVIYFDAFAPSKQAELWSLENLEKCAQLLKSGGILTTYCAQGQFKRNLAAAGFEVQTLKGAMGKKEMVRGIKK